MNCLATIMLWPLYLHVYQTIVKLQHLLLGENYVLLNNSAGLDRLNNHFVCIVYHG
jgi:hypothetical protein